MKGMVRRLGWKAVETLIFRTQFHLGPGMLLRFISPAFFNWSPIPSDVDAWTIVGSRHLMNVSLQKICLAIYKL